MEGEDFIAENITFENSSPAVICPETLLTMDFVMLRWNLEVLAAHNLHYLVSDTLHYIVLKFALLFGKIKEIA